MLNNMILDCFWGFPFYNKYLACRVNVPLNTVWFKILIPLLPSLMNSQYLSVYHISTKEEYKYNASMIYF